MSANRGHGSFRLSESTSLWLALDVLHLCLGRIPDLPHSLLFLLAARDLLGLRPTWEICGTISSAICRLGDVGIQVLLVKVLVLHGC